MWKTCLAAVVCLITPWRAFGATVEYVVDPARSVLHLSGVCAGLEIGQQGATPYADGYLIFAGGGDGASLYASWSGVIVAERDTKADTLCLTGGSMTAENGGLYAGASTGPQSGQYGVWASTMSLPGTSWYGAIRDLQFALSSPTITLPAGFDSALLAADALAGHVDYLSSHSTNTVPVVTATQYDTAELPGSMMMGSGTSSLATVGDVETLTIPLQTQMVVMMGSTPLTLQFSGDLVATRSISAVPEPSSLAVLGLFSIAAIARRRPRRVS